MPLMLPGRVDVAIVGAGFGGLGLAIWNINRYQGEEPGSVQRDL